MTESHEPLKTAPADRYTMERELGAGGMATVYLAQDLKHGRKVALKVLRKKIAAVLGSERFLREIELAAGLQHPPILPVYDSGARAQFGPTNATSSSEASPIGDRCRRRSTRFGPSWKL
jgi:serine/threonine-protein kinase